MNKTLTRTLVVAVVAVVVIASIAIAQPDGRHGMSRGMRPGMAAGGMDAGMGPLARLEKMQERLGLSDAQVAQIKTIFADVRTQNAASRDQLHGNMGTAMQLLLQNPNDVAGAQKVLDQQLATERTLRTNMLAAASKALNVLTPEQRAELAKAMAERGARRKR
ncbi:MAG: Spy/CpxP family protein refolding chaperone [Thermoanaerobaculia bacterium]